MNHSIDWDVTGTPRVAQFTRLSMDFFFYLHVVTTYYHTEFTTTLNTQSIVKDSWLTLAC